MRISCSCLAVRFMQILRSIWIAFPLVGELRTLQLFLTCFLKSQGPGPGPKQAAKPQENQAQTRDPQGPKPMGPPPFLGLAWPLKSQETHNKSLKIHAIKIISNATKLHVCGYIRMIAIYKRMLSLLLNNQLFTITITKTIIIQYWII